MSNDSNPPAAQEAAKTEVESTVADAKAIVEAPQTSPVAQPEEAAKPEEKKAEADEKGKKKKSEKKEEPEDKVVEEKIMTINLRHAYLTSGRRAAPKAVRLVKKVTCKIFKTKDVSIGNSLNELLWARGKTKTARRVTVKVQKLESGTVRVLPAEA